MINLSNRRRQDQVDFLELTAADVHEVQAHQADLVEAVHRAMEDLPRRIAASPETRRVIQRYSIERHRNEVTNHMISLADGVVDDAYVDKRITVGQVHD